MVSKFLRRKPRTVREVLEGAGLQAETIDAAEEAGTDELLAIGAVVLPKAGTLTIDELTDKVGADVDVVRLFWRALGFADPVEGERSFTKRDVKVLRSLLELTDAGLVDPDLSLRVARVIGVSMAQLAATVVDASETRSGQRRRQAPDGDTLADARGDAYSLPVRAAELLPFMSDVIDYSFRRHLRAAARRRLDLAHTVDGATQVVGFADLVRFTQLSLQLDQDDLDEVVGRFDELVNETVVRQHGRIIKMIGDGAMFAVAEPAQGALIALELADAVRRDDRLPGIRIGLASGQVLTRDGDLYGPVVNLASRLVDIGRAGAVNIDQDIRAAIAGDQRFGARSLGERSLRHIGDVKVYRLRPGPGWSADRLTDTTGDG